MSTLTREVPGAGRSRIEEQPVSEATYDELDEFDASEVDADAALADLWDRYVVDRAPELRDRLILHYAPLVKYVAGRVGSGLPASG
jgi:RNA polymerase sigma factor for flagellar operon FliA